MINYRPTPSGLTLQAVSVGNDKTIDHDLIEWHHVLDSHHVPLKQARSFLGPGGLRTIAISITALWGRIRVAI